MYKNNRIFVCFILFLAACHTKNEKEESKPAIQENVLVLNEKQASNVTIKTDILLEKKMSNNIVAYGTTFYSSENLTTVASPFGGIIKSLPVIQGQNIAKEQVVAILEDPKFVDMQQEYLLAKSRMKLTQLDFERQKDLNQYKANSDKVYQQAENEYRTQQILVKSLSEKLKLLGIDPMSLTEKNISKSVVVRSTHSGIVSAIYVNSGKYIMPSENMLDMIHQTNPLLKLKIYEKDLKRIYINMKLVAYLHSDTGIQYPCVVRSINPSMMSDGSSEVICHFTGTPKNIFQNMNMIARLDLSPISSQVVPVDAIVHFEGKNYLFTEVTPNKYEMQEAMSGDTNGGYTEILNNEAFKGKRIVIEGAYSLLMALKNREE